MAQKRCATERHLGLIVREYRLCGPSFCFECDLGCEEILRDAGAPRAGLSAGTIDRLQQKLRVSSSSLEVLRRKGLSPECDERRGAELLDALIDAALIAQRDLLVESRWLHPHGDCEHLTAQVSRDFRAAARWARVLAFDLADVHGTRDQWQTIHLALTQTAKAIAEQRIDDEKPGKLNKLADPPRKRGRRVGLEIVRDFKRSLAEALERCFRSLDEPARRGAVRAGLRGRAGEASLPSAARAEQNQATVERHVGRKSGKNSYFLPARVVLPLTRGGHDYGRARARAGRRLPPDWGSPSTHCGVWWRLAHFRRRGRSHPGEWHISRVK